MSFIYAIALTGSISTGKSTAALFLKKQGFSIIDADSIAHQILNEQHKAISQLFGETLVIENQVNRKSLGAIVFSDEEKRKQLENLLHPLIFKEIEKRASVLDKKRIPYLIDIPLFFEGNRYPISKVLVVYTPISLQLQRLMERDTSSKKEAQKRINTQLSIEEKRQKADYVIDNSGTLAQLERECKRVKDEILKDFK
jgi:dephospho-CoA kinase